MGKEDENDIKIHLNVEGMSCSNCEVRIKNMLDSTDGIYSSQVSYRTGKADVIFDSDKISLEDIKKKIEDLGYSVCEFENNKKGAFRASLIKICIILLLFAVLQYFGVLNYLVPSQLADSGMGYSMLFVIGLITSVHCIAMCGGINLSQSLPADAKNASRKRALLPSLLYNLGRVISYTFIGFVLGFVGMIIGGKTGSGVSNVLQGILKIIAGLFMVIMGINMLGIFPKLRKISFQMPASFSRKVNCAGKRSKTPLVVGLLNALMPCGPLQSMQIIALASANPLTGALSMLVFSLGTVPLMLGLGSVVSLLGHKFSDKVMTVGSVLVAVLGLSMLSQGGSLSGFFTPQLLFCIALLLAVIGMISLIPFKKALTKRITLAIASICAVIIIAFWSIWNPAVLSQNSASQDSAEIVDGVQVVHSTLYSGEYPNIQVQCGIPVKWIIEASEDSINGCNYQILIDEYGLKYTFHAGENIIEFTPENSGNFSYSCWMGMIYGKITVTE